MGLRWRASDGEEKEVGDLSGNSRRLDTRIKVRSGMRRIMFGVAEQAVNNFDPLVWESVKRFKLFPGDWDEVWRWEWWWAKTASNYGTGPTHG